MSVLIKGMQIPKNCRECPVALSGKYCRINKTYTTYIELPIRPDHCPLSELPEHHGDLIDRDALSLRGKLKLIEEREIQIYGGVSWSFSGCITAINNAPAIIEAE